MFIHYILNSLSLSTQFFSHPLENKKFFHEISEQKKKNLKSDGMDCVHKISATQEIVYLK